MLAQEHLKLLIPHLIRGLVGRLVGRLVRGLSRAWLSVQAEGSLSRGGELTPGGMGCSPLHD